MSNIQCGLCLGQLEKGFTDVTMRRGRSVIVVEAIPAEVCDNCGEAFLDQEVAQKVNDLANNECAKGVTLEFCKYSAA